MLIFLVGKMTEKSQQGIREIVHNLLSILEEDGVPRISPELFRRAKFNKPAAIGPFWTTLYYILQLAQYLEAHPYQNSCHCAPLAKVDQEPKRTAIQYVRWHLFFMGYSRTALFSDNVNSRELFLAFGWTLHKTRLFGKLIRYHIQAANNRHIPLKSCQVFILDSMRDDIKSFGEEVEVLGKELNKCSEQTGNSEAVQALKSVLQRLVWLKGKILYRWKAVLTKHQGFQKMADRVHRYTQQLSGKNLTVHEAFLLKHPDQLTRYLTELERHLLALQRLLDWRSSEHLFWQWMESVLDLEESEKKERMDNLDLNEEETHSGVLEVQSMNLRELGEKVKLLEQEVCVLLEKNRPHIDKINRSWMTKSKDVAEKDIQEELSRIESFVGVKVRNRVHEWPCSLTYRSQIEQLSSIDLPVHSLVKSAVEKNSKKTHLVGSSFLHERHGVTSDAPDSFKARLVLVNDKLKTTAEKIERSKLSFTRQLETIESLLPSSVCKVET